MNITSNFPKSVFCSEGVRFKKIRGCLRKGGVHKNRVLKAVSRFLAKRPSKRFLVNWGRRIVAWAPVGGRSRPGPAPRAPCCGSKGRRRRFDGGQKGMRTKRGPTDCQVATGLNNPPPLFRGDIRADGVPSAFGKPPTPLPPPSYSRREPVHRPSQNPDPSCFTTPWRGINEYLINLIPPEGGRGLTGLAWRLLAGAQPAGLTPLPLGRGFSIFLSKPLVWNILCQKKRDQSRRMWRGG